MPPKARSRKVGKRHWIRVVGAFLAGACAPQKHLLPRLQVLFKFRNYKSHKLVLGAWHNLSTWHVREGFSALLLRWHTRRSSRNLLGGFDYCNDYSIVLSELTVLCLECISTWF